MFRNRELDAWFRALFWQYQKFAQYSTDPESLYKYFFVETLAEIDDPETNNLKFKMFYRLLEEGRVLRAYNGIEFSAGVLPVSQEDMQDFILRRTYQSTSLEGRNRGGGGGTAVSIGGGTGEHDEWESIGLDDAGTDRDRAEGERGRGRGRTGTPSAGGGIHRTEEGWDYISDSASNRGAGGGKRRDGTDGACASCCVVS